MEQNQLATLIETGLKDLGARITDLGGRVDDLGGRVDDLAARIDDSRAEASQRSDRLEKDLGARIDDLRVETGTHFEGLRREIRLVVEGVATVDEKLDRHIVENAQQFEELRGLMQLSDAGLERRVSAIEQRYENERH